jgi:hypothetical protein
MSTTWLAQRSCDSPAFALVRRVYAHSMRRGIEKKKTPVFTSLTSEKCQFMPTSIASIVGRSRALVLVADIQASFEHNHIKSQI